jgi:hypothetical protein
VAVVKTETIDDTLTHLQRALEALLGDHIRLANEQAHLLLALEACVTWIGRDHDDRRGARNEEARDTVMRLAQRALAHAERIPS